jgi:hypothetical protein
MHRLGRRLRWQASSYTGGRYTPPQLQAGRKAAVALLILILI